MTDENIGVNTMYKPMDIDELCKGFKNYEQIVTEITKCDRALACVDRIPEQMILDGGFKSREDYKNRVATVRNLLHIKMMQSPFRAIYELTERAVEQAKSESMSPLETEVNTEHDKVEIGDSWEEVYENMGVDPRYR